MNGPSGQNGGNSLLVGTRLQFGKGGFGGLWLVYAFGPLTVEPLDC